MISLRAFSAWRPSPEYVSEVASLPYDVVDFAEAREIAGRSPHSFMRVIRSEVDLADDVDVHSPEVYRKAKENLEELCRQAVLIKEETPSLYIYQLTLDSRSQTGVVGLSSVDDYDSGLIKTHEKTREDKELDRTTHLNTLGANTGPVFLTYRSSGRINSLVKELAHGEPLYDFISFGGVRHQLWRVAEPAELVQEFSQIPCSYVADGHHRAKSASIVRKLRREANPAHRGDEPYNFFLSVLFPDNELSIQAYNRLISNTGHQTSELRQVIEDRVRLSPCDYSHPRERGEVCVYFGSRWYSFCFSSEQREGKALVDSLDVQLLGDIILAPVFGIDDPRTSENISFVGGIRGTEELESAVDSGRAELAFSMFPVSIDDLLSIADAGLLMPPKSTWFEPKLLSGLLVNEF